jgi:hypothetical protein
MGMKMADFVAPRKVAASLAKEGIFAISEEWLRGLGSNQRPID